MEYLVELTIRSIRLGMGWNNATVSCITWTVRAIHRGLLLLSGFKTIAYIWNIQTYPKATSLRYHPLLNRDLLAELFKGTVAGGKEAVSIHLMTRQMDAAKNCNDSPILEGNESEKEEPSSPEMFPDDWEESLPNTPREWVARTSATYNVSWIIPIHGSLHILVDPVTRG